MNKNIIAGALVVSTYMPALDVLAGIDTRIPIYKAASGVSGNLSSVGSDTLANLMVLWAVEYKRQYPNVNIQIQAAGSVTAPPALTKAVANIAPMSRKMKAGERAIFEKKYHYTPTAIKVAIDALAVYVNKDNPIKGLSIPQVDAIFSSTRKCGMRRDITTWGQLGLTGVWKSRVIQLFGRNALSGTHSYFRHKALCKGDYKNTVNEQLGSASVVESVGVSLKGIGYSGIGYKIPGVRAVTLTRKPGQPFIDASPENAFTGSYPLARFLYIYVNKQPNRALPLLEYEFLKLVLSRQGQQAALDDGYIPLPYKIIQQQMTRLH